MYFKLACSVSIRSSTNIRDNVVPTLVIQVLVSGEISPVLAYSFTMLKAHCIRIMNMGIMT